MTSSTNILCQNALLDKASQIIVERRNQYGSTKANFAEIAKRWSSHLHTPVTSSQVALCMMEVKMARLSTDPLHQDSLIDVVGYAACLSEIQAENAQTQFVQAKSVQTEAGEGQYEMAF